MDGEGGHGAHAEGRGEQVRPGAQVGHRAQELHAVALLLQGILRGGGAFHFNGIGLDLQGLLGLGGQDDLAVDDEGSAHVLLGDLLVVFQGGFLEDDLDALEAAAVV